MKSDLAFLLLAAVAIVTVWHSCMKSDELFFERISHRYDCEKKCSPKKGHWDHENNLCTCEGK